MTSTLGAAPTARVFEVEEWPPFAVDLDGVRLFNEQSTWTIGERASRPLGRDRS